MKNTVGVSDFVKRQKKGSGKTYTKISFQELASYSQKMIAKNNFSNGYRDGVILIDVSKKMLNKFESPLIKINKNTKLTAEIKKRRNNEKNYISIKALNGKPLKLEKVQLILYRKDVLKETNENSTNKDWELIAFFGVPKGMKKLPMGPITMMRNQLELPGGTKANYTSKEWAESVKFWQEYTLLK
ncbi:MAG: hypothetical protein CMG64_02700 [Candidatus Marinimicrobia bacterium]|nr:hypothetical protein [Candidatus Neomarinimicrobiota bacterium]|tara:strand:+ start:4056 stop:4613 length:558 start_codon:yes stop_codon:yes gene_type:complete